MAGTDVNDLLLTSGQNQGVETAVLPAPQLLAVNNLRMRKGSRWGKRFGHTALSTTTLGTGTGLSRAIGGGKGGALTCFALVDDRCSVYDQTAAAFAAPFSPQLTAQQRVAGAASGWLPDTSFFPVPQRALQLQTTTPCATCYAFGYLWTVIQFTDTAVAGDKRLRIVATDPSDQTVVRLDDFGAAAAGFGGISYPKLMLVGSTLVLTYLYTSGVGATHVWARSLTSLAGGWSAQTQLTGAAGTTAYDASGYSATQFLVAIAAGISAVALYNVGPFAPTASQNIVDASGNPLTEISVVGTSGGPVYVGYACAATPATKVIVFTANLVGTVGTATLAATAKRPLLVLLPAGGVRAVFSQNISVGSGSFVFRDVTAAAVAAGNIMSQVNAYPVSIPFAVGARVYLWTKTETGGLSYATLLQLPPPSSFALSGVVSCPLEMSVQDYLVSPGQGLTELDQRGVPAVAQLGTTAAYAVPVPTLYAASSTIATGHDFRILQAKHFTDNGARRSVSALYADSSSFLPLGALTRVDDRGTIEEGFVHAPTITGIVAAAGPGALTLLADYYYTSVYKSRNSNGRYEESAPSAPVKVTLTGGQNQNTVSLLSLGITARPNTVLEVYRTLGNGQTFYLNAILDSSTGVISYLDQLSDTAISTQKALYTQVGQTLPNAFPPPARFGCVGGGRLFLGGQMRPDIVQGSKLIFGDQSPSFADADAFRIVLPAPCTGLAWMDVLCIFTAEGIYIASGEGPDDSGVGDFGGLTRMPYELGCIEPRSVIVVDDGCFFQTARGLYLLPRGFGAPIPAGDTVQDTFATYPVITGAAVLTKATEQTVHWSCIEPTGNVGTRIVYDLAHKAWGVDSVLYAPAAIGQWAGGEVSVLQPNLGLSNPALITNNAFSDAGNPISAQFSTGDLRPFGVLSEGTISKLQLLAELRSACTLSVFKGTENGSVFSDRIFALAVGDYQIGQLAITEVNLGSNELRAANRLRLQFSESSTTEGLAFIAMAIEHEQGEGLKRAAPLSRIT